MSANDVNFFLSMRAQVKLFHWQTTSYARHKATDELIKSLDDTTDKYVEIYMGTYGRPKMTARNATIHVQNRSEKSIVKYIKACIAYIEKELTAKLRPTDTDLVNLRDEMLGELNQLMYLFTLH